MKKIVILALAAMLLASCSTKTFVQIVDVDSNLSKVDNNYVFNDGKIKVIYDFWDNYGQAGFMVENLTDEIMYIDLANSFFVRNGVAYDYYKNRVYSKGSSTTKSSAVSLSAAKFGFWLFSGLPGAKTLTVSEAAASSSSSSTSVAEKEIQAIPAHTCKFISEYAVVDDVMQDCSIRLFPKKNKPEVKAFDGNESPLTFSNVITYKVGEEGKATTVTQDFSVIGYGNYRTKEVYAKVYYGCNEQVQGSATNLRSPARFYVHYNERHNNDYSADAAGSYYNKTAKIGLKKKPTETKEKWMFE